MNLRRFLHYFQRAFYSFFHVAAESADLAVVLIYLMIVINQVEKVTHSTCRIRGAGFCLFQGTCC